MIHKNLPKFNDGAVHFITTKTYKNTPYFLDKTCSDILVEEIDFYRKRYGFKILGYVIMPEHFHLLVWWDIEENKELTISKIIQSIKSHSARRILEQLGLRKQIRSGQGTRPTQKMIQSPNMGRQGPLTLPKEYPPRRMSDPEHKIWQRGFYDFNVISGDKFRGKLNYIHNNPFKDKRIRELELYQYSSRLFYETGNGVLSINLL